jgi:tol-pal system protein YbgF
VHWRQIPVLGLAALLGGAAMAQSMSTEQRLELLERRASRITELTLQLDEMRRDNRELRGAIENLTYEIEQLKRKQRDIYLDIDQRIGGLQGGAVPPPGAPASTATATPETPTPAAPRPQTPAATDRSRIQAEYQAAYALLSPQQRRYQDAANAFAAFIDKYPGDPLTPNAKYWLGEAYYVSQQNAPALAAFEQVVADHPGDTKAPGALYKIGRLKEAAGDRTAARAAYQRVLKDYPGAPAAGLSRQRLQELGG